MVDLTDEKLEPKVQIVDRFIYIIVSPARFSGGDI